MKAVIGTATLCAVVKANGYGHGGSMVAKAMLDAGADSLGVAIVDEGIELPRQRRHCAHPRPGRGRLVGGARRTGLFADRDGGSLRGARDVICSAEKLGGVHRVHVKVDTGMHRMGVDPSTLMKSSTCWEPSPNIDLEGLFTHFSVADGSRGEDRAFTRGQIELFNQVAGSLAQRGAAPGCCTSPIARARWPTPKLANLWCAAASRSTVSTLSLGFRARSKKRVST